MKKTLLVAALAASTIFTGTQALAGERSELAACYVGQGWSWVYPEAAVLDQEVSLRIETQDGNRFTGVFEKTGGHGCTGEQTADNYCHGLKFVGSGSLSANNGFSFKGDDNIDDDATISLSGHISSGHQVEGGCDGQENLCAINFNLSFRGAFFAPYQPLRGEKAFMTLTAVPDGSCPAGTPDP